MGKSRNLSNLGKGIHSKCFVKKLRLSQKFSMFPKVFPKDYFDDLI